MERPYGKVKITPKGERKLRGGHPWVFDAEITETDDTDDGGIVDVYTQKGSWLGAGFYNSRSKIRVRLISRNFNDRFDESFWRRALRYAVDYRRAVLSDADFRCCRLIFGEADRFPGLTVDRFEDVLVTETLSLGMERIKGTLFPALVDILREQGAEIAAVYERNESALREKEGIARGKGFFLGSGDGHVEICENGIFYDVDYINGQKTGFFLDQRDNRARVGALASGRNVLNLFCYTGGFSIYALKGGAVHVDSVDSSARAMDMVGRNVALNGFGPDRHTGYCTDAIDFVKAAPQGKYDLIIVDPPAFAKHRGALQNALRAYRRLNAAAIRAVAPGGLVFTFSCSQVVDREAFSLAVFSAAAETGRSVRILARLGQGADHAVNIYHPEGEYLKGLLLYVE